jgi:YVTN family beta-propeller protein
MRRSALPSIALCLALIAAACSGGSASPSASGPTADWPNVTPAPVPTGTALPGMPTVLNANDIYAADRPNALSSVVKDFPSMVYVPNSDSNTVDVIDPKTMQIVNHFPVGKQPQHIVPSYDLKTLYATDDLSNDLVPIDAATGKPGAPIPVEDPYNLYFTPDGQYAIVVAERMQRLDFRDPHTMAIKNPLRVACNGVDHMDFSADGTYLIASCEFAGTLIKVDVASQKVVGTLALPKQNKLLGKPQDVKLSPDGRIFYVADMNANGVYEIDGTTMKVLNFLPTGVNAHGLYVSRDSKVLYVSNRGEGSVSLIDFASRKVTTTWHIPGGGSPDMGGVSADGTILWLTGRYNAEVYAISTTTGQLVGRVKVGKGPHGLCVWPQPGRYSLGHTGILR